MLCGSFLNTFSSHSPALITALWYEPLQFRNTNFCGPLVCILRTDFTCFTPIHRSDCQHVCRHLINHGICYWVFVYFVNLFCCHATWMTPVALSKNISLPPFVCGRSFRSWNSSFPQETMLWWRINSPFWKWKERVKNKAKIYLVLRLYLRVMCCIVVTSNATWCDSF